MSTALLSGGSIARPRLDRPRHGAAARAAAAAHPTTLAVRVPTIKICGVTRPEEALHAARCGAALVGLVLWPGSRRAVTDPGLAREIAAAAREGGAEPVAVFVDEDEAKVVAACDAAGITIAQLHGDASRESLAGLPSRLRAIYCLSARADGSILTPMPGEARLEAAAPTLMAGAQGWRKAVDWVSRGRRTVDHLLVDGSQPGSGQALDWSRLRVARGAARRGWLLAGGLTAENVGAALSAARPDGVDVASGVAGPDGVLKDAEKVARFCAAVREWAAANAAPLAASG